MFFVGVDMLGQWLWTACSHMPWFTARLLHSLARGAGKQRCVGFMPEGAACELLSEAGLTWAANLASGSEHYRLFALSENIARPAAR